jgi:hypothetical protein
MVVEVSHCEVYIEYSLFQIVIQVPREHADLLRCAHDGRPLLLKALLESLELLIRLISVLSDLNLLLNVNVAILNVEHAAVVLGSATSADALCTSSLPFRRFPF